MIAHSCLQTRHHLESEDTNLKSLQVLFLELFLLRTVALVIPLFPASLLLFLYGLGIFGGLFLFKMNEVDNAGGG